MLSTYPAEVRRQVIDLARLGTRVAQLAETFGMPEVTIYNWTKQEKIDRGELEGAEHRAGLGAKGDQAPHPPARD
jgi:transposase-like protein